MSRVFPSGQQSISLASLLWVLLGFIAPSAASEAPASKTPKNIIFILTDDQRFDELGFMNPILETPNMDKLTLFPQYSCLNHPLHPRQTPLHLTKVKKQRKMVSV